MRVVVLGATGTTGRLVLEEALKAGHEVVAFVRRPEAIKEFKEVTACEGSIENEEDMMACFSGADAVISCLGERPSLSAFVKGTDFQRRTLPRIIAAVNEAGVGRFVLMSSFGSGETAKKGSIFIRTFLYGLVAKKMFDDKAVAEESLPACKANWTAVYPVTLSDKPALDHSDLVSLDEVTKVPGIPLLPFANVAQALVGLVKQSDMRHKKLLLTTKGGWE